ncbi:MAG: hypothetical protein LBG15_05590 [Dysgonamonadaceae bacterium]|jgi:hypothetical protein|nr:hypothetical protein [Dysgonamonadaceae bacterium]
MKKIIDLSTNTVEKRLFGLRYKLASMYDDVQGMELYKQTQLLFKQ